MKQNLYKLINSPGFIIISFWALLGCFALNYHQYYPDEHYYTDAALTMIDSGDYLTPKWANGDYRFNKPILSYWIVALSYKIFGVSPFSSRIFFFLLSGFALLFIYRIGKLIFDKDKAMLAMLITASQVSFFSSATRSIPDVVLCTFMTVFAYGLAGIIKHNENTPKKFLWYTYIGLALAIEAKGLPALVLGTLGIGYALINPWRRVKFKVFIHPSLLVGLAIAFWWFAAMYIKYEDVFLSSFYNDQVGVRLLLNILRVAKKTSLIALLFPLMFVPWIFYFRKPKFTESSAIQKAYLGFAVLWVIAIIILSGFVEKFYDRYFLPVIPITAILLANIISRKGNINQKPITKITIIVLSVFQVLIWIMAGHLNFGAEHTTLSLTLFIIFPIIQLAIYFFVKDERLKTHRIYLLFMTLMLGWTMLTSIISFPTYGNQITSALATKEISTNTSIGFYGERKMASKIRVSSGHRYKIKNLTTLNNESIKQFPYIIVEENRMQKAKLTNVNTELASTVWEHVDPIEMLISIYKGTYKEVKDTNSERYYLISSD